ARGTIFAGPRWNPRALILAMAGAWRQAEFSEKWKTGGREKRRGRWQAPVAPTGHPARRAPPQSGRTLSADPFGAIPSTLPAQGGLWNFPFSCPATTPFGARK